MVQKIKSQILSVLPLKTQVKNSKTSKQYIKYAVINKQTGNKTTEETKRIASLIVNSQKKQLTYTKYNQDGSIEKVVSHDRMRTYYKKDPKGKEYRKIKELGNGVKNLFEWYMNIYDESGRLLKQIVKGTKGSPFNRY